MPPRRTARGLRFTSRCSLLVLSVGLAGCGQPVPATPDSGATTTTDTVASIEPAPTPAVTIETAPPPKPSSQAVKGTQPPPTPQPGKGSQPTPQPTATTVFSFPKDLGGQQLSRVVTPSIPPLPQTERFGQAPKIRNVPVAILSPEPVSKPVFIRPPIPSGKTTAIRLATPPESVPPTLGAGADAVPQKPTLPENPGIATRAPNVNLPPAIPTLARQVLDRASLDDPTAEPGNAVITLRGSVPQLLTAAFQKVGLPDPFELGDQVKPNIPPTNEPGFTPVPVNPERPK